MEILDITINNIRLLLDTAGFPPRWACGSAWTPLLGWVHIISDIAIFVSYTSIPICILIFLKSNLLSRFKYISLLFVLFILLCGFGHLTEASIFWHPWYRLSALVKVLTAIVSVLTAAVLIRYLPKILSIPEELGKKDYLEYILNNTPYPLLLIDKDLKIKLYNNEFCNYTKYKSSELLDKECLILFPQQLQKLFRQNVIRVMQLKTHSNDKLQILHKDDSLKKVEISFVFLMHEDKEEVLLAIKDIEQSDQLKLTSKRLKAILDTAADAIITIDNLGYIGSFNAAAERMFGYQSQEAQGENIKMLMPDSYAQHHDSYIANYIKTGEAKIIGKSRIVHGRTKQGDIITLELSISEMNVDGEIMFTGILRDITERIEMEEKIKGAYEELESFAYIAAHDLREPLRGINNYATFLLEDYENKLDEEGKQKLHTLQKLSKRLEGFIESLLYYSRLDTEAAMSQIVDLNHVVEEVLLSLTINIQAKNVKIEFKKDFPTIKGNNILINELYGNLITNAMKYNDKSDRIIEIGHFKNKEDMRIFFVRDNGIGIKGEHFNLIFRMFKRLHSRDHFEGGAGMGLSVVKKVVQKHGGKIWVESELGKGTTFYFTLEKDEQK